jgi:hypothetical protein
MAKATASRPSSGQRGRSSRKLSTAMAASPRWISGMRRRAGATAMDGPPAIGDESFAALSGLAG